MCRKIKVYFLSQGCSHSSSFSSCKQSDANDNSLQLVSVGAGTLREGKLSLFDAVVPREQRQSPLFLGCPPSVSLQAGNDHRSRLSGWRTEKGIHRKLESDIWRSPLVSHRVGHNWSDSALTHAHIYMEKRKDLGKETHKVGPHCLLLLLPSWFSHVQLFSTYELEPTRCSQNHATLLARVLEWVVISFARGSSWPRDWTCVSFISCIDRWVLFH